MSCHFVPSAFAPESEASSSLVFKNWHLKENGSHQVIRHKTLCKKCQNSGYFFKITFAFRIIWPSNLFARYCRFVHFILIMEILLPLTRVFSYRLDEGTGCDEDISQPSLADRVANRQTLASEKRKSSEHITSLSPKKRLGAKRRSRYGHYLIYFCVSSCFSLKDTIQVFGVNCVQCTNCAPTFGWHQNNCLLPCQPIDLKIVVRIKPKSLILTSFRQLFCMKRSTF